MRWLFDDRTDIDDITGFEYLEREIKGNQKGRWINPEFPKDNWDYVECYELEDNNHVCDMDCGQKHIRYVHVLYHKEKDLTIHIGKECAVLHIHHHVPEESRENILRALSRQKKKAIIKAEQLRNYELNRLKLLDFIYSEQNKSVDYVEQLVKTSEVLRIDYENQRPLIARKLEAEKLKKEAERLRTIEYNKCFESLQVSDKLKNIFKNSISKRELNDNKGFVFFINEYQISLVRKKSDIELWKIIITNLDTCKFKESASNYKTYQDAEDYIHVAYNWAKTNLI